MKATFSEVNASGTVRWNCQPVEGCAAIDRSETEAIIFKHLAFQDVYVRQQVSKLPFTPGCSHKLYTGEHNPYRHAWDARATTEDDLAELTTRAFMAANPEIWNDPEEDAIWADW